MTKSLAGLSRSAIEQAYEILERRTLAAEERQQVFAQQLNELTCTLQAVIADRDDLRWRLEFLQRELYGRKSERSEPAPEGQENFLAAPVEQDTESGNDNAESESETITYKRKKSSGRRAVPKELPEKVIELRASDEERIGPNGERLVSLGFEETRRVDIVPERLQVLVIRREKLGLPDTREYVCTVPMPPNLVPGGKATDQFMLVATLRKYVLGLPLYRQTELYNSQGANIADNFLGECVRHIATAFEPIAAAIREQVLASRWVFADETPVRQLKDAQATVRTSYFWAWVGNRQVSFHFGPTRSAKEVRDMLGIAYDPDNPIHGVNADLDPGSWEHGQWIGFIICDGYQSYHPVFQTEQIRRVACWIHARRRFKLHAQTDRNAAAVTALINRLFHEDKNIRKAADKQQLLDGSDARHAFIAAQRQQIHPPIIAELDQLLERLQPLYAPDLIMGQAITYIRNRWKDLQVFLDYGFLPMENNTAERAIRPIAVGRKNWLFVGSEDGGNWAATMFSIVESCRLQKIDPHQYCEYILDQIVQAEDRTRLDYAALTPAALHRHFRP